MKINLNLLNEVTAFIWTEADMLNTSNGLLSGMKKVDILSRLIRH